VKGSEEIVDLDFGSFVVEWGLIFEFAYAYRVHPIWRSRVSSWL